MFRPYMAIIRFFPLRFRYKNCDVEISHPIIILVCLCIGGYYITLKKIYIYSLSVGRGVGFILGVSAGCQPPLPQGVAVARLSMIGLTGTVLKVKISYIRSYMFRSIWTILRELTLNTAKVTFL